MSKKLDTWMPLYIGDYLADTSRLTTEQHGAYLLLLMDYWRNGPPPDDDEVLASITRLNAQQWRKHAAALRAFFTVDGGTWTQKRAESERQRAAGVNGKRAESGKAGAAKRWGKGDGEVMANGMASAMPNAMANGMANPSPGTWQNDASAGTPSQSQSKPENQGEPVVIPAQPARSPIDDEPPGTSGQQPTAAGRVCRAMRQAGLQAVNPGDSRLAALLDQGITEAEFVGVAAEAVGGGKGWAWVLTVVQRRRADAAAIAIAPGGPPQQRGPAAPNTTVPSAAAERTQALLREQSQRAPDKPSPEVMARLAAIKRVPA